MHDVDGLSITAICWAGAWKIHVAGELDLASTPRLIDAAVTATEQAAVLVEFDLSRVTFSDCAGWDGFEEAVRVLERAGVECRTQALSPAASRISRFLTSHPAGRARRPAPLPRSRPTALRGQQWPAHAA